MAKVEVVVKGKYPEVRIARSRPDHPPGYFIHQAGKWLLVDDDQFDGIVNAADADVEDQNLALGKLAAFPVQKLGHPAWGAR